MMKRNPFVPLLILLCLFALTSCQGKTEAAPAYDTTRLQAMVDAGAFSEELEELDGDTAFALYRLADYGLSREDLTDCAVLRSAGATCEEGAVLIWKTQDQAKQATQALADYIQGQIESNRDYRPGEIPKLEKALIDCRENTLLLAVANDYDAANAAANQ